MSEPEQKGPLVANLRKMAEMMPKWAKGVAKKALVGGARKMMPSKVCKVCKDVFDVRLVDPKAFLDHGFCPACQQKLDEGWTAVRHGDLQCLWLRLPKESPNHGKLVDVVAEEYAGLKAVVELINKRYEEQKAREDGQKLAGTAPIVPTVHCSCDGQERAAGCGDASDPVPNPS